MRVIQGVPTAAGACPMTHPTMVLVGLYRLTSVGSRLLLFPLFQKLTHDLFQVTSGSTSVAFGAFLLIADRVEHVRRLNSQGREARGRGDLRGTCPLSSVPVPTSMRARQDTLLHVLCFLSRSSDLILPFACIRRVTLPADGTHAHLLTPSRPPLSSPSHQHPTLQPRASSSSGRSSSTPSAPPALRTGARR